jgi:LacI family transcriptional regulator
LGAARILKDARTKTIGLLVPGIADSFFSTCAEAAEEVARVHDSLLIVVVSSNDTEIEMSNLGAHATSPERFADYSGRYVQ